jgi:hypothetical protein
MVYKFYSYENCWYYWCHLLYRWGLFPPLRLLTHKTHNCGHQRILMLCMKNPCMTRNLECELWYLDGVLLPLYSLKKQWTVNVIVQCSTISSAYLRKLNSPTPGFNRMAHTANNSMKLLNKIFRERVICRDLWPPRSLDLTPPDFTCGEQQNLQFIVIAHARLLS